MNSERRTPQKGRASDHSNHYKRTPWGVLTVTWTKLGDEFSDECAPLSDAAYRTHSEALQWTMRRLTEGVITERDIKRFAETKDQFAAVAELVAAGYWERRGDDWLIVHHMAEQRTRKQIMDDREKAKARQQTWRDKKKAREAASDAADDAPEQRNGVTNGVTNGVSNGAQTRPDQTRKGMVWSVDQTDPVQAKIEAEREKRKAAQEEIDREAMEQPGDPWGTGPKE